MYAIRSYYDSLKPRCSFTEGLPVARDELELDGEPLLAGKRRVVFAVGMVAQMGTIVNLSVLRES